MNTESASLAPSFLAFPEASDMPIKSTLLTRLVALELQLQERQVTNETVWETLDIFLDSVNKITSTYWEAAPTRWARGNGPGWQASIGRLHAELGALVDGFEGDVAALLGA